MNKSKKEGKNKEKKQSAVRIESSLVQQKQESRHKFSGDCCLAMTLRSFDDLSFDDTKYELIWATIDCRHNTNVNNRRKIITNTEWFVTTGDGVRQKRHTFGLNFHSPIDICVSRRSTRLSSSALDSEPSRKRHKTESKCLVKKMSCKTNPFIPVFGWDMGNSRLY